MFYLYANAKSEIQICSNKHEIGLALLVQYFHNILDFRPLVIFCYRKARFMSDLVINPEGRVSHAEVQMFSDCTYDMKTYNMVSYLRLRTGAICVRVTTGWRLAQTPQPVTKVCLTRGIKHLFMLNAAEHKIQTAP